MNKVNWNDKLIGVSSSIRVDDGYTQYYMRLTNGIELNTKNMVERFGRRLLAGWDLDLAYNVDPLIRIDYQKNRRSVMARKGGIACQKANPHIREIASENLRKARESGANREKFNSGELSIWNKGLTKETDSRVMDISKRQHGEFNTVHRQTPESRANMSDKISAKMKDLILCGKFTPNIHNSRTHWQVEYNGQKFRSSWEAAWHILNPEYEYETKRIKYFDNGKERIYIIDFYDPASNTLVEIKPKEHLNSKNMITKIAAAKQWAIDNCGEYKIITQDYLIENMNAIMGSDLPELAKQKIKGIK